MIFITGIFVNNIILSQFLGICPFLRRFKKNFHCRGYGFCRYVRHDYLHYSDVPDLLHILTTLRTHFYDDGNVHPGDCGTCANGRNHHQESFAGSLSGFGNIPAAHYHYCAVLGIAILTIQKNYTLVAGVCYALAASMGFTLAIILFAGIRERLNFTAVPKALRGTPIALISAGLLSMAFMGFAGISN